MAWHLELILYYTSQVLPSNKMQTTVSPLILCLNIHSFCKRGGTFSDHKWKEFLYKFAMYVVSMKMYIVYKNGRPMYKHSLETVISAVLGLPHAIYFSVDVQLYV